MSVPRVYWQIFMVLGCKCPCSKRQIPVLQGNVRVQEEERRVNVHALEANVCGLEVDVHVVGGNKCLCIGRQNVHLTKYAVSRPPMNFHGRIAVKNVSICVLLKKNLVNFHPLPFQAMLNKVVQHNVNYVGSCVQNN